jgi:hypothetical protein
MTHESLIDADWQSVIDRLGGAPLALRLVAIRKPPEATEKTRTRLLAKAREKQHVLQDGTLVAAGWVIRDFREAKAL